MAFARDDDAILIHLSTGAGAALRAGREAAPLAISVCAVDALVYATTLYDSSMNYRSAVVHGVPEVVLGEAKNTALELIAAKLMPGRAVEVPENSRRELAGTLVLRIPITTVSMKARSGEPGVSERLNDGAWAGLLPLVQSWGEPVTATFVAGGVDVAASVEARIGGAVGVAIGAPAGAPSAPVPRGAPCRCLDRGMTLDTSSYIDAFAGFIQAAPSSYHAAAEVASRLSDRRLHQARRDRGVAE